MNELVSIIIPTYNEANNIYQVIERTASACEGKFNYEIIVVDDNSPDGTALAAWDMSRKYPVKVIVRQDDKGLSSAVLKGFSRARGNVIGVIDADLSHPPEKIPELIKELENADIVVGSRRVKGGGTEKWPVHRKLVSAGASLLAYPIAGVKDPMSGFFFLKRKVIEGKNLNPVGYKILLEILVKGDVEKVSEVPFIFKDREIGESKLKFNVYIDYLKHLVKLYYHKILG